jgi:hypothetical protein
MNKGKGRCKFEVGDSLAIIPAHPPDEFAQRFFGDHGPIHPDAFPEIDKVGGRVQPNPVAGCLEDSGEGRRDGPFPVGASHKNAFTAFLGTTEALQKSPDRSEARLDAAAFQTFEVLKRIRSHKSTRAKRLAALEHWSNRILGNSSECRGRPIIPLFQLSNIPALCACANVGEKLPQPRGWGQPLCDGKPRENKKATG